MSEISDVRVVRIADYINQVVATRQLPRPEVGQNLSLLCINLL